jgi:hypothetical protein
MRAVSAQPGSPLPNEFLCRAGERQGTLIASEVLYFDTVVCEHLHQHPTSLVL